METCLWLSYYFYTITTEHGFWPALHCSPAEGATLRIDVASASHLLELQYCTLVWTSVVLASFGKRNTTRSLDVD